MFNSSWSHVTERITIPISKLHAATSNNENVSKSLSSLVDDYAAAFGHDYLVHVYSGLGFMQNDILNQRLSSVGFVDIKSFISDFEARGIDKWTQSVKNGRQQVSSVYEELQYLDNRMILDFKTLSKSKTLITPKDIISVEKSVRLTLPTDSSLREAFDIAGDYLYEFRINAKTIDFEKAGIMVEATPGSTSGKKRAKVGTRYVKVGGERNKRTRPIGNILLSSLI